MRKRTNILYITAWLAYMVFSYTMFPRWNSNVAIPLILIMGLGSWLYGTTRGLLLMFPTMIYHFFLLSEIYADIFIYYQTTATSTIVLISIIVLAGKLRENLDSLKEANEMLDQAVMERTAKLDKMIRGLINSVERTRIARGQELHDGIGQQLTGIQLYSSSLAEQLRSELNTGASLAYSLNTRAQEAHTIIRSTARSLFPVRMNEFGLHSALTELADNLLATRKIHLQVHDDTDLQLIPHETALQLYRICQETILGIGKPGPVHNVHIRLSVSATEFETEIIHDGQPIAKHMAEAPETRLILFRIKLVEGSMETDALSGHSERLVFRIPRKKIEAET